MIAKWRNQGVLLATLFVYLVFSGSLCYGETLTVPAKSEIGALFFVDVTIPESVQGPQRLNFESSVVQYLGPVVFTTEAQNPAEGVVEINKSKPGLQTFSLKFLPLPNMSTATFRWQAGGEVEEKKVSFVVPEGEKSYHLPFLILGLVLLFLARYLWNYQKKNPSLMSTRSLFMNFEELQKVQEALFPAPPPADNTSAKSPSQEGTTAPPPSSHQPSETTKSPIDASPSPPASPTVLRVSPPGAVSAEKAIDGVSNQGVLPTVPQKSAVHVDTGKLASQIPPKPSVGAIFLRLSDSQGRFYEGTGKEISLGRGKGNVIVFSASEISRNHAIIRHHGTEFVIKALSATNLTEVNDQKGRKETPIKTGDTLTMGGTVFRVVELG